MQANVATPSTANSFLRVTHMTRTRRVHKVTASSLYHLLQNSYLAYCSSLGEEHNQMSLEDWYSSRAELYTQFKFWLLILQLELALAGLRKSYRRGRLQTVCRCLTKIAPPWFLVLDHTNYVHWIPVHLRDMVTLKDVHRKIVVEWSRRQHTDSLLSPLTNAMSRTIL